MSLNAPEPARAPDRACALMPRKALWTALAVAVLGVSAAAGTLITGDAAQADGAFAELHEGSVRTGFDHAILKNIATLAREGRETFRFDTFGDETFWGDKLKLHRAIEGARFGGVGPGVSPKTALALGLKVDLDALPAEVVTALRSNQVNLDDPATTLLLLKANAVVGLTGFFNADGSLKSVGIQCALCHSTVDNKLAYGIGHRLDGWANHDLDVGKIVAIAPDLTPFATLLNVPVGTVKAVLNSWGPGKFDAQLSFDGKAFNPAQMTDGVVTATNVPGATLIPDAFGLAGFNQHTWTGAWGTLSYWNALVATLEMHGVGRFFDPRLNNPAQYPIAAANNFGNFNADLKPEDDRVAGKLPALHFYQLALPAPTPRAGRDFDPAAAKRGDEVFSGKASCNTCHVDPLWTEPGWNLHKAEEICIDSFQADRAPDHVYKTASLNALFVRERGLYMNPANRGRFYHDGRFATLLDVVNHYDRCKSLGLSDTEKRDLVEYLKSLPEGK